MQVYSGQVKVRVTVRIRMVHLLQDTESKGDSGVLIARAAASCVSLANLHHSVASCCHWELNPTPFLASPCVLCFFDPFISRQTILRD